MEIHTRNEMAAKYKYKYTLVRNEMAAKWGRGGGRIGKIGGTGTVDN